MPRCLEEVGVDEEAARYAITALWNRGVVGLLATLGPDDDGQYPPAEDLEDIRDYLDQRFSGPGRGRTGVLQGRVALQQVGANPGDMAMDVLRQVPEQRVAAVLGIPAAVLGFGSGLDATKVGATMAQMERQAIRNGVLPDAEEIAETLTMQLNIAGVAHWPGHVGGLSPAARSGNVDAGVESASGRWRGQPRRGPDRVEAARNAS